MVARVAYFKKLQTHLFATMFAAPKKHMRILAMDGRGRVIIGMTYAGKVAIPQTQKYCRATYLFAMRRMRIEQQRVDPRYFLKK